MISILVIILVALVRVDYAVSLSNETALFSYARCHVTLNISSEYNHTLHDLPATFSCSRTIPLRKLYGLSMCRGDIDQETCRVCVKFAQESVLAEIIYGNAREAGVWYEYCMFRYSEERFFGKYDKSIMGSIWDKRNKTGDPARFMQILRSTLNSLALRAAYDGSGKRFGTKVVKITAVDSLYTLVQCTWNLAATDCYKCLKTSIKQVRKMGGSKSGNVMQLNCLVRYEMFPFFDSDNNIKALPLPSALNSSEIKLRGPDVDTRASK